MALIDRLFSRSRSLSDLDAQELRRVEIRLSKQRDRLVQRTERIDSEKKAVFERGVAHKSSEVRQVLAQQFDTLTSEQQMIGRELNVRGKEFLTVSRLRMMRERRARDAGKAGPALFRLTDRDVARISGWIEDDAVGQQAYTDRLDALLELGRDSDREASGADVTGGVGREVLDQWEALDRADSTPDATARARAYDAADRVSRRRHAADAGSDPSAEGGA